MKKTLLELTNAILLRMDSDPVNSINDTVESESVAQEVRDVCQALWTNRNWDSMRKLINLTASGTVSRPTHMSLNEDVKELIFINYNCIDIGETRKKYKPMKWLENDAFLRKINNRNNDQTTTDVIQDVTGIELLILNNKHPEYFTSFDDTNIVFDSYNSSVDSTLQTSKVQAEGYVYPTWVHEDDYIPQFPSEAFTAILEESKSRCMFAYKQMQDIKAEQEAGRQNRWLSRKQWRVNGGVKYPSYGRCPKK